MQQFAEQKVRFVAGVSHELRTPAAAIAVLARNQAEGLAVIPDQVREYGLLMHQQSMRLVDMVEQTLQFAGLHSAGRKPLREVNLEQVVVRAIGGHRHKSLQSVCQIELDCENDLPPILGDAEALERAIRNLIDNAEKYSRTERWIRVGVHRSQGKQEMLITVKDRGMGIDQSEFDRIFEPFERSTRSIEAQIPGTGLGLTLVKEVAEAHGGYVTVASELDRGSCFTLHLPIPGTPGQK